LSRSSRSGSFVIAQGAIGILLNHLLTGPSEEWAECQYRGEAWLFCGAGPDPL
jgi:hypothetical protein